MSANGALVRHDRCVAPKSLALTVIGGRGEAVRLPCFADQRDRGAGRNHAGRPGPAPIFRDVRCFGEEGKVSNGAIKARVVTIAAVTGRSLP